MIRVIPDTSYLRSSEDPFTTSERVIFLGQREGGGGTVCIRYEDYSEDGHLANGGNGLACLGLDLALALLSGSMQRRGNSFFFLLLLPLDSYRGRGWLDFSKEVA